MPGHYHFKQNVAYFRDRYPLHMHLPHHLPQNPFSPQTILCG